MFKKHRSILSRTFYPKSIFLRAILLFYWGAFFLFTGLQIYHGRFVTPVFLLFLSPLVQIYTILFFWNLLSDTFFSKRMKQKEAEERIVIPFRRKS